ncbi:hypothetical protein [Janthinobacterium sp. AD80]|uniref:hypothetical protein n=1 Tax=Janthinobacterium sp. AD80 TaxID=1528773 RepID=UPI0015E0C131|nr:hypothetical protein [Janthinobacterium sp. AD80]
MAIDEAKGDDGAALVDQHGTPFAALVAVIHRGQQLAAVGQHGARGVALFADGFERLRQQQFIVFRIAAARVAEKIKQRGAHLRLFAQARQRAAGQQRSELFSGGRRCRRTGAGRQG